MNPIAVAEIVDRLALPDAAVRAGARSRSATDFDWKFVNYAPIVTIGALLILTIWWHVSAKNWFTGPEAHHRRGRGRGLRRLTGSRSVTG